MKYFLKSTFPLILSLCIYINLIIPCSAAAIQADPTPITEIDAILIACSYLKAPDLEGTFPDTTTIKQVLPLYSENGQIVAFYVALSPHGYAVINNNSENPIAIEFGVTSNTYIQDILDESPNSHIIYNNPTEIYVQEQRNTRLASLSTDLYTYYPALTAKNNNAAIALHQLREVFSFHSAPLYDDGDYGFIDWRDMPIGGHVSNTLTGLTSISNWALWDNYSNIADNHCGAVAVTNLSLIFATKGHSNLYVNQSVDDTFKAVHKFVGNGPKATIAGDAKEYFSSKGYSLNYSNINTWTKYSSAIQKEHPCCMLLENSLTSWHWVVCVGYRAYTNGANYYQIQNGWDNNIQTFYLGNSGSTLISITEYWI